MITTAVEWLTNHILNSEFDTDEEWQNVFEQAKEMEEQQIIDAFEDGYGAGYRDNGKFGTEYYKETFKKKEI